MSKTPRHPNVVNEQDVNAMPMEKGKHRMKLRRLGAAAGGQMLLQLGCTQAQGYCIARPMPLADFIAWTAAWQPPAGWQKNRPV